MTIARILPLLSVAFILSGCPLDVIVSAGGDVSSASGTRDCAGGNTCQFEVADTNFVETFTAMPRAGNEFLRWEGSLAFLCSDSPQCTVDTTGFQGNPNVEALLATTDLGTLKPIFRSLQRVVMGVVENGAAAPGFLDTEHNWNASIDTSYGPPLIRVTFPDMQVPCSRGVPQPVVSISRGVISALTPPPYANTAQYQAQVVGVSPCGASDWSFWVQLISATSTYTSNFGFAFSFIDPTYPE